MTTSLYLSDFDYTLPEASIARYPLSERSASRLLMLQGNRCEDYGITDLPKLLQPGDLLVMNDSRVLHARLLGVKESGGRVEVLVERTDGEREVLAQIRASKPPKPGTWLHLEEVLNVEVLDRQGEFWRLRFPDTDSITTLLERHGRLPLPPYIDRHVEQLDESRYQTIFAREHGSVAAPTAGLHFDRDLLTALKQHGCQIAYITLHVGAGTFQPVRVNNLSMHKMHHERYSLPQSTVDAIMHTRHNGGRVIAVGTTTLRTLESAAQSSLPGSLCSGQGETDLFILPGFQFRIVDLLLTNFHLPKSTLLMLVSAFAGTNHIQQAYTHAITHGYRFFSYGDAMLLGRMDPPTNTQS